MDCRLAKNLSLLTIGFCLMAGSARAGWITITNDTDHTLVVQESTKINGQVRKCKPFKLAPGEVIREFHQTGGTKCLSVSETGLFGKQLFSGNLTWKDDIAFSIHEETKKITITDVATLAAKAKALKAGTEVKTIAEKNPR